MTAYARTIHPFPARMAPDTITEWIESLPEGATILDPMCGSGVTVRQSLLAGHRGVGVDIDPLAVLMSRVWTKRIVLDDVINQAEDVCVQAQSLVAQNVVLPWIDECEESKSFIKYWFALPQRRALRRISYILTTRTVERPRRINDLLWLALSRTVITKQSGASLAWDVSHSRPHKVRERNDFDVYRGFVQAVEFIANVLGKERLPRDGRVYLDDSRKLSRFEPGSFDAVFSSPPYMNAIDYFRGHKFSLVWMGYTIPKLRMLRATAVGAERAPDADHVSDAWNYAILQVPEIKTLPPRQQGILVRYVNDSTRLLFEFKRILKSRALMVLVLGDSLIRGRYIANSRIYACLAQRAGFELEFERRRPIETHKRYLPIVSSNNTLENRMRHETVQAYRLVS